MNKLANRYQIFAREYVIDLNGTRSAIAAGYAASSATSQASFLLTKPKVQKLIKDLQAKRATRLDITADKVIEEFGRLAFSNILDYIRIDNGDGRIDLSTVTRDQAAAIQEIREDSTGGSGDGERKLVLRTTFKLADKQKALEALARKLGLFQDKVEHSLTVNIGQVIYKRRLAIANEGLLIEQQPDNQP